MTITAGSVLVASPQLLDPSFLQSVVYIIDHGDNGTLGFIVNRPLDVPLHELWEEVPYRLREAKIATIGGPVERDKGLLLHGALNIPDAQLMTPQIAVGGSVTALVERYSDGADATGPRLFLGHSGWAPGQLEKELEHGSWLVRPGKLEWLLNPNPLPNLWKHLLDGHVGLPDPSLN